MSDTPSRVSPSATAKNNPTAKFSRIFDLLSLRDPTLNSTLYEDVEFAGLLRDMYAALREKDDILSAVIERTIHQCGLQAERIPINEWCVDYAAVISAAKAEVATKLRGEKPCRVCGETTLKMRVQVRTDDEYLPQIHVSCVNEEEQYD